ncbi:hypothetical protein D3C78_1548460 [compost metagenome]
MDSTKAELAPRKATIHIQNTAPGPPKVIAVATPAMLPVPTRPASVIASAWNDDTPLSLDLPSNIKRIISPKWRTWAKRVRMEKNKPTPRQRKINPLLQIQPFRKSTAACMFTPQFQGRVCTRSDGVVAATA